MITKFLTAVVMACALVATAQIRNPGFELAGATASQATNWTITQAVGGPVYAVRTNSSPRSGTHHLEVRLVSTGAGPVVEVAQTGIPVLGGASYPFTFYSKAVSGSAGYNAQWRVVWNAGGETGFRAFTLGNNAYSFTSNSIVAPATATSATLYFYFAGAASPSLSATLQIDNVSWGINGDDDPADPGTTNSIAVSISRASAVRWFASNSVTYQVQWATALNGTNTVWNNLGSTIPGNGALRTIELPAGQPQSHFRVISYE